MASDNEDIIRTNGTGKHENGDHYHQQVRNTLSGDVFSSGSI